jgi:hypothetical protein
VVRAAVRHTRCAWTLPYLTAAVWTLQLPGTALSAASATSWVCALVTVLFLLVKCVQSVLDWPQGSEVTYSVSKHQSTVGIATRLVGQLHYLA